MSSTTREEILQQIRKSTPQRMSADLNPFDLGAQKAQYAARAAFNADPTQQSNALHQGLVAFSRMLAKQANIGPQKGFLNNLAALNVGIPDALDAYDNSEKSSIAQNLLQAEKYQAQKERQDEMAQKDAINERKAVRDELMYQAMMDQHAESRRHNRASEEAADRAAKRLGEKDGPDPYAYLDGIAPVVSDANITKTEREHKLASTVNKDAKELRKEYNELKQLMGGDLNQINMSGFVHNLRSAGTFLLGDPKLNKIVTLYDSVNSRAKQIAQAIERNNKNPDVALDAFSVKYGEDNNLFPNITERSDSFEKKLSNIEHDAKKAYDVSLRTLNTKRLHTYDNYDQLIDLENQRKGFKPTNNTNTQQLPQPTVSQQQQKPSYSSTPVVNTIPKVNNDLQQNQRSIRMLDPATGNIEEVESHLVKAANDLGLVEVK